MKPLIPYFQTIKFDIPLPEFISSSPLSIYGFGITLATGILLGAIIALNRARAIGMDTMIIEKGFIWAILSVIVGGHIGYGLFYEPEAYFADPIKFLDLRSGMSSLGGFIFCFFSLGILVYRLKAPIWPAADCAVKGFALGWFFGRLGCTLNHEHPGSPSNFFLARYCRPVEGHTWELPQWAAMQPPDLRFSHCVEQGLPAVRSYAEKVTTDYQGVIAVHDMGLYEVFYAGALFLTFVWMDKKPRFHGSLLLTFIFSYASVRFFMEFLRPLEGNPRYAELTPAQWGAIIFMLIWLFIYKQFKHTFKPTHPDLKPV